MLALLLPLAAGCGGRPFTGAGGVDDGLSGRTFLSSQVTEGGAARPLVAGTTMRLRFMDDGRLLADAGCNTMSGSARTSGGRLRVEDLAMTEMGCDPARQEQDGWLADLLGGQPSWQLDGDTLVLTAGGTEVRLTDRRVVQPDRALEGARWRVDTIVDGQVASSVPAGGQASVVFSGGTAQVETGCNSGSAPYRIDGATITVSRPSITRRACPAELAPLEQAVLAVLDGAIAYRIDSDRLTLDHPSGRGLVLDAERP